jgi:hypothetical protein
MTFHEFVAALVTFVLGMVAEFFRARHASRLELRNSLQLAALDARLAAHQKAYALWWKLRGVIYKPDEIGKFTIECQDWWVNNNLYLGVEVREAFYRAYMVAGSHQALTQVTPRTPQSAKDIESNWSVIAGLGPLIERSVDFPTFSDPKEKKPVEQDKK